jgi:hypothetical protein
MTAKEWERKYGYALRPHNNKGTLWIPDSQLDKKKLMRYDLFHLSDYAVSSITGGSVWLIPRSENAGS